MSTPPSSLAWRRVSAQLAWPACRSASTAARPAAPASGARPWSRADPVGAERIERPVLEEDVDRLAEGRGAGGQDRGGLQLVVGPGEEDQVQGLVHDGHLEAAMRGETAPTAIADSAAGGSRSHAADDLAETRQASLEDGAHEPAGHHDVRVGEPVADLTPVALGLDDAGAARSTARCCETFGWLAPIASASRPTSIGPRGERVEDLEPARTGQRLEDLRLEDRDLVHDPTIDICADADECWAAR